jgi:TRAP-type mannitol/chloroaromatic compound transport system substrate-binding protein
MAKLGLSVTNIAPGELYTSLERGTIDALEWVGPGMDVSMGCHKIAPYYYTGWHEPATELHFMVNEKSFNELPTNYQQILLTAMRVSAYDMYIKNYHMSSEAWANMLTEFPNIKVKTFPKEVMDAMKKANTELLEEVKKESPIVKEVLESQEAYQKKSREWTKMSDFLYLKDNL